MSQGLQSMLKGMAPDHDWAWLAVLVANLKRAATSTRDKRPHMVDPHALYELGISLMTDARSWALNGNYHARSEEHTSELQSLMRISYAVFCLKKKKHEKRYTT